jgi:hypothetical protein
VSFCTAGAVGIAGNNRNRVGVEPLAKAAEITAAQDRLTPGTFCKARLKGKGCGKQNRDQYARHLEWPVQPPQAPPHLLPRARDLHFYLPQRGVAAGNATCPHQTFRAARVNWAVRPTSWEHLNGRQVMGRRYDRLWEIPRRPCRNFLPEFRNLFDCSTKLWRPPPDIRLSCARRIGSILALERYAMSHRARGGHANDDAHARVAWRKSPAISVSTLTCVRRQRVSTRSFYEWSH